MARETHHAFLVQLFVGVSGVGKTRHDPVVSSTCSSTLVASIGSSAPPSGQSCVACVFLIRTSLCGLTLMRKSVGDPQPHGMTVLPHLTRAII